ncbi:MAG: flagellar export chaperone FliS [Firmicutes bacterium]|nr:flagellar export chaperone FliS [Bacillota bacterium]
MRRVDNAALQAYRASLVQSASPAALIELLLRKAVAETRAAAADLDGGRRAAAHGRLLRAQEIVQALRGALNREAAPELAERLEAIYDFAYWRLVRANASADAGAAREALEALEPIREAWSAAFAPAAHGGAGPSGGAAGGGGAAGAGAGGRG